MYEKIPYSELLKILKEYADDPHANREAIFDAFRTNEDNNIFNRTLGVNIEKSRELLILLYDYTKKDKRFDEYLKKYLWNLGNYYTFNQLKQRDVNLKSNVMGGILEKPILHADLIEYILINEYTLRPSILFYSEKSPENTELRNVLKNIRKNIENHPEIENDSSLIDVLKDFDKYLPEKPDELETRPKKANDFATGIGEVTSKKINPDRETLKKILMSKYDEYLQTLDTDTLGKLVIYRDWQNVDNNIQTFYEKEK